MFTITNSKHISSFATGSATSSKEGYMLKKGEANKLYDKVFKKFFEYYTQYLQNNLYYVILKTHVYEYIWGLILHITLYIITYKTIILLKSSRLLILYDIM